jgi:hypothetical protein
MISYSRPRASCAGLVLGLAAALAACGGSAPSDDVIELDGGNLGEEGAHEHGVARLSLAVDDTEVTLNFRAPGASLYGFEHEPRDAAERRVREEALERVRNGLGGFVSFAPEARCTPEEVHMEHEPGHGDDHDHDGAHADGGHTEVEARVLLRCATSPAGTTARLRVADVLPDVVHVDLIVLSGTRQGGARVAPDARFEL